MRRLLRALRILLRPRNLRLVRRVAQNPAAQRAARTWRRGDSVAPWLPIAVPVLVWFFGRSFEQEEAKMRGERAQVLKREKQQYDQAERRFLREIVD